MKLLGDDGSDPMQWAITALVAFMKNIDTRRDDAKAPWSAPRWAVPSVCYTCGHRRAFRGDPLVLPDKCRCDRRRGGLSVIGDADKRPARP